MVASKSYAGYKDYPFAEHSKSESGISDNIRNPCQGMPGSVVDFMGRNVCQLSDVSQISYCKHIDTKMANPSGVTLYSIICNYNGKEIETNPNTINRFVELPGVWESEICRIIGPQGMRQCIYSKPYK